MVSKKVENEIKSKIFAYILCQNDKSITYYVYLIFLGRFRIFENRPLDPVFYFLSKCEKSKLVKSKKLKNCLERSKLTTNAQLGSAPLSLTQLSLA